MMLTNLIDAIGTWKMEGSWPFSDSWHVTALWQPESICSSSRCVCTLLPYRVPAGSQSVVVGGERSVLQSPHSSQALKKEKERKSATNHDGIDCFASKRPGDFDRVVAHQKP